VSPWVKIPHVGRSKLDLVTRTRITNLNLCLQGFRIVVFSRADARASSRDHSAFYLEVTHYDSIFEQTGIPHRVRLLRFECKFLNAIFKVSRTVKVGFKNSEHICQRNENHL
jgi:hypothetical protein